MSSKLAAIFVGTSKCDAPVPPNLSERLPAKRVQLNLSKLCVGLTGVSKLFERVDHVIHEDDHENVPRIKSDTLLHHAH